MQKHVHGPNQRLLRELLRALRQERGLRQADVAGRLNEPQSFVSKYETGERRLDVLELREVCLALGVTLPEFASRLEAEIAAGSRVGQSRRKRP